MQSIQDVIARFDRFQQKHRILGFPLAVFMKFGDDQAGNQAAIIAYYGFLSLFPLLLVFFSVVSIAAGNNDVLTHRVIAATVQYFPFAGQALQQNIHEYHRNGLGLVIGLLFTFYGARGIANAIQSTSNHIWQVPYSERPGFPWSMLRSFGIIIIGGAGLIGTSVLISFVTGVGQHSMSVKILLVLLVLAVNAVVFLVVSRLATANKIPLRALLLSAVLAAIFWQIIQAGASFLLLHQLQHASALYGAFSIVLGLLAWFYIQAQLFIYSLEIGVVKYTALWPRSILQKPLTAIDKKIYIRYAESEQRKREQRVRVDFKDPS
jgi:YihY family inner membrane protein